jgi:anti-sigma-K factor RskA
MNTTEKEARELPPDVELLLPWHAAGTLSRRDAARVEEALAKDEELARRYEMVREELGEAIRLNESLGAPSARALEKLFAKIDAEPARKPKASFGLTVWFADFVSGFSPRTLAYGAAAAAVAIVLQAGILAGVLISERAGGPQLASVEQRDMRGEGAFALVRFKPEANAAAITKFLEDNKATIVGGPAAGTGLFRLRVAEKELSNGELAAIVKSMATSPVVDLALPAAQP